MLVDVGGQERKAATRERKMKGTGKTVSFSTANRV
jgi:hypothetical protein